ncbi:hypothetical protein PG985_014230 [Apiospora marii]|uniref:Rhodopsin domain-containing protein n=1 Tax=Apiospora marii TaxID=335849 RepID=A0ABR1R5P8_9PEZI
MSSRKPINPARATESNLGWILGVTAAFHGLALIFVGLRTYTRLFIAKTFGKDDALMLMSTACAIGGMAMYIIAAFYGLGHHADTISKENYKEYLKMAFIQTIVTTIGALACLKVSIGLALIRLSDSRRYAQIIWGMIGFVCIYAITSLVELLVNCRPIAGFWDESLGAKCLPAAIHKGFALMNTACNLFTDVAFTTLPVPIIMRLQMAHRARVYLLGILGLGCAAVLLGVAKVVCQNLFRDESDQSFTDWAQFFGFLQVNVGIVAACAPSLLPLVGGMFGLTTIESSSLSNGYNVSNSTPSFRFSYGAGGSRRDSRMVTISGGAAAGGPPNSRKGWLKSKSGNGEFEMNSDMLGMLREQTRSLTPDARAKTASPAISEGEESVGIIRTVNFSVSSIN